MASYLETAMEIAREAGALLTKYFERRVSFELKGEFDLVTEADLASEKLVMERLSARFPRTRSSPRRAAGARAPRSTAGTWTRWTAQPTSRIVSRCSAFRWDWNAAGELMAG